MKNNNTTRRFLCSVSLLLLLAATLLVSPSPAHAAGPIYVTTWADEMNTTSNGKCSLREAIVSANNGTATGGCTAGTNNAADVIILPANMSDGVKIRNFEVTINPSGTNDDGRSGDLDILEPVTISGAGPTATVIAGDGGDRVFHIIETGSQVVTIQNLAITGGANVEGGGGILNFGSTLVLKNVYLYGNHANAIGGGAIRNHINLIPNPDVISYLTVINSTIDANFTTGDGGGISNDGVMVLNGSLISNNTAAETGGGISNAANIIYTSRIINSTITGNIGIKGAGLYSTATLQVINSTIHDNRGTASVGSVKGIMVQQGTLTLKNTIISGHLAPRQNCDIQIGASVVSNGHNLSQDATCGLSGTDQVGVDPQLDTFDYHGGPTQLFSLNPGSPAIDMGANADCPSIDQRGMNFGRPSDGDGDTVAICDVGAYEADALPPKNVFLPWLRR
jgi:CSLREA domain-containing protein